MKIKADRIADLPKFGFRKQDKDYVLQPTGLFTTVNLFVDCDTRRIWCGFKNDTVTKKVNELVKADMVEVEDEE